MMTNKFGLMLIGGLAVFGVTAAYKFIAGKKRRERVTVPAPEANAKEEKTDAQLYTEAVDMLIEEEDDEEL